MKNSKRNLILIGGGGHCRSCIDVIELEGKYSIRGVLDIEENIGKSIMGYKILGIDADIPFYAEQNYEFLITVGHIGNAHLRKKLYEQVLIHDGVLAKIISPRAYVAKSSSIKRGSIIMHDALINSGSGIGENCIINTKALVEHDCHVEAHCHVSTSSVLNGGCTIGEGTFFGSNAVSKQGAIIEPASFIKANSCFVSNQKKRVAFLSTVFPIEKSFVLEFFKSLSSQTVSNFDLIVLNDGFPDFHKVKKKFSNLKIIELSAAGSISKNREALIQYAKNNNYDIAIFGDCDDVFSPNRVESSINELYFVDLVVNDITSIEDGKIIEENFYSHRLENRYIIDFDYIKEKNIFGLSNTAINLKCLPLELIQFPSDLIAVDWYLFSLLLNKGVRAIFTNNMITFYRQHGANTIGIGAFTSEKIKGILQTKALHYKYMQAISPGFEGLLHDVNSLNLLITNESQLIKLLDFNHKKITHPLWWELTDFRNEK